MPKRIALTSLNGRTIDILNVIRNNASYEYQQNIPVINDAAGIPGVGEVLYGNPTLANEFINALVNRIALVVVNSAVFNNPYRDLKKGFLEYGESVEEIFVKLIEVHEYSVEKAASREFKNYKPKAESAFHIMNWKVLYPVSIERENLKRAFLSADGVENLITSIVEQIYTSASYDEFLLFKYLLIKTIATGKAYPVAVDMSDTKNAAVAFRGYSNMLTFMKDQFNVAHVKSNTPKERQYIFMDSQFNAQFDVEVLSAAFNMDKADFMGRLHLIDDWTSFDNERFEIIRTYSDMIEEVTAEELALMQNVKAVLVDERFFQVYDNETVMTDQRVGSGLYWNYFYHTWKTISFSPFANIIAFVDSTADIDLPDELEFKVASIAESEISTIITLEPVDPTSLAPFTYEFVQTKETIESGIAVHPYGAFIVPVVDPAITAFTAKAGILGSDGTYTTYSDELTIAELAVGTTVTLAQDENGNI